MVDQEQYTGNLQFDIAYLRKNVRLMVGTPMYGGQCSGVFAQSMGNLKSTMASAGVHLREYYLMNESLITRARNYITDEFLRSDCTHLLFIDSDIGFNPSDVLTLLGFATAGRIPGLPETYGDTNPYDIIGAPYPKKCISWEKIAAAVNQGKADEDPAHLARYVGDFVFSPLFEEGETEKQFPMDRPVQVLEIGTGYMLISKKALERIRPKFIEEGNLYTPDHPRTEQFNGDRDIVGFFLDPLVPTKITRPNGETVDSKRHLSEDYYFCQKAREFGARTWLCPWINSAHVGSYVFDGTMGALAEINAHATADPRALGKKIAARPLPQAPQPGVTAPKPKTRKVQRRKK